MSRFRRIKRDFTLYFSFSGGSRNHEGGEPKFAESIRNVSAVIGKDAVLNCFVDSLGAYKVGWMRSDQSVLSVGKMVTQHSRYSVNHEESNKWSLRIHNVRESDEGCYICQINTFPLLKQSGCIQLQYPPDISDLESSADTTIHEGKNVTLHCTARGNPTPRILWRRDGGDFIRIRDASGVESSVDIFNGSSLKLMFVRRDQMSAYLCIAVNGVEPAISKRIFLRVQCEILFSFANFLLPFRLLVTQLYCIILQSHPTSHPTCKSSMLSKEHRVRSIALLNPFPVRWVIGSRKRVHIVVKSAKKFSSRGKISLLSIQLGRSFPITIWNSLYSEKYVILEKRISSYKTRMILTISNLNQHDAGSYVCVSGRRIKIGFTTKQWNSFSSRNIRLGNPLGSSNRTIRIHGKAFVFRDRITDKEF